MIVILLGLTIIIRKFNHHYKIKINLADQMVLEKASRDQLYWFYCESLTEPVLAAAACCLVI